MSKFVQEVLQDLYRIHACGENGDRGDEGQRDQGLGNDILAPLRAGLETEIDYQGWVTFRARRSSSWALRIEPAADVTPGVRPDTARSRARTRECVARVSRLGP